MPALHFTLRPFADNIPPGNAAIAADLLARGHADFSREFQQIGSGYARKSVVSILRGLSCFVWFGRAWWQRTHREWVVADCLLEYVHHRIQPLSHWPHFPLPWKASTAANKLGILRSHCALLGIPLEPLLRPKTVRKALFLQYPGGEVVHRPAFNHPQFISTLGHIRALGGASGPASAASAAFAMAYFSMMRAGELARVMADSTWVQGSGPQARVVARFKDKTHVEDWRVVLLVTHPLWQPEFELLSAAVQGFAARSCSAAGVRVFSDGTIAIVENALKFKLGFGLGSIRPSGLMFHLQRESPPEMVTKLGGWSPQSATMLKSYVRLDHDAAVTRLAHARAAVDRISAMDEAEEVLWEQPRASGGEQLVAWL